MRFRAAVLLVVAFAMAHANGAPLYRCTDAHGKDFFSDQPCPGQPGRMAYDRKGVPLSDADRQKVMKNMGVDEKTVRELEAMCLKGFPDHCTMIDTYKRKTAGQVMRESDERAKRACAQGDKEVCDSLRAADKFEENARKGREAGRRELLERYDIECRYGDKDACANAARIRSQAR